MTKSPAQNWSGKSRASASGEDRNVQTEEGRAGSAEKRSALCGPLRSSCPPYQGSTDPLCLCLSGWDWFDLTVVSLTDLLITCLFVCLVIVAQGNKWTFIRKSWNIDNGSRHRWLHFGDFPDTTGTFDLSKIKAKLSECFSSLSFFLKIRVFWVYSNVNTYPFTCFSSLSPLHSFLSLIRSSLGSGMFLSNAWWP